MISCYRSKQSKLILFLGLIAILISILKYYSLKLIFIQGIFYYLLAYQSDCLIFGACDTSAWITILYPCIAIIIFILDYLKYFERIKNHTKEIYKKLNILNNTNFKEDIEKELTK